MPEKVERVKYRVETYKPFVLIGSPPCTAFCSLRNVSQAKRDPEVMKQELARAEAHVRVCMELYTIQVAGGRYVVHEHPARARSWLEPIM